VACRPPARAQLAHLVSLYPQAWRIARLRWRSSLLGRVLELVRFPGESHELWRNGAPDRWVERLRRIAGLSGKYLLGEAGQTQGKTAAVAPKPAAR